VTELEAYRKAYESVSKSFEDIGDFNTSATPEDIEEMQLHVLMNLAMAFKQVFEI
jgi:hypothetical protein